MKIKRSLRATMAAVVSMAAWRRILSAAGAVGTAMAPRRRPSSCSTIPPQPFGIDGAVPIDFNSDSQIDFEIDHDNIDLGGGNVVDFLQIDKNDTNGGSPGENPCPINVFDTFDQNGTRRSTTRPTRLMSSPARRAVIPLRSPPGR